jgi:phage N-6-adenine-methyltransferase
MANDPFETEYVEPVLNSIPTLAGASIVRRQPERMRQEQAKADAIIQYARKVKNWPLLEEAVALKIADQRAFVQWWRENVSVGHGGDRSKISDLRSCSRQQAEALTGIQDGQVSRWRQLLAAPERYRERMIQAAYRAARLEAPANHRAECTGENEWFTPPQYIEAARSVLGEIDLDPATNPVAQKWIRAKQHFTRADNALQHEWCGRVWLNPPYARGEIGPFIAKLADEIQCGHVTAAILLTHSYTDTEWFHHAVSAMQALCFTNGRVKFVDDAGEECAPTQGQIFFYYGPQPDEFASAFGMFGFIAIPWTSF